jgi:Flp pilus assembly protein TadG
MYELLTSMGIKVKLPIICCVDNIGAIFMAENVTATSKSKHIDTKAKFVAQFIQNSFLKIIFVKTKENTSDIFTKNVNSEIQ